MLHNVASAILAGAPASAAPSPSSAAALSHPAVAMGRAQVLLATDRHAVARAHLDKFAEFAKLNDMVIVVRASTRGSDRYKLAGHATKPMTVKAKTCDFGIARALVCRDPRCSKLRGQPEKIRLAEANLSDLLDDPASGICATPLLLSGDDLLHLCAEGEINYTGKVGAGPLAIRSRDGVGGMTDFLAKPVGEGIYAIAYPDHTPLQVLADSTATAEAQCLQDRKCAQLTADYDLAILAPRTARRDSRNNVRLHSLQKDFIAEFRRKSSPTFHAFEEGQECFEEPLPEIEKSLFGHTAFDQQPAPVTAPAAVKHLIQQFEGLDRPESTVLGSRHVQSAPSMNLELTAVRRQSVLRGRPGSPFDADHKQLGAVSQAEQDYIRELNALFARDAPPGTRCPDLIHHGPANNIVSSDADYADSVVFFPRALDGCDQIAMASNKSALDGLLRVAGANGYPCLFERPFQLPHRAHSPAMAPLPQNQAG